MRIRDKLLIIMVLPILLGILVIVALLLFNLHDQRTLDKERLFDRVSVEVFELNLLGNDAALHPAGSRARSQWSTKFNRAGMLIGEIERQQFASPTDIANLRGQLHALGDVYHRLIKLMDTPEQPRQLNQARRNRLVGQLGVNAQTLSSAAVNMARKITREIQQTRTQLSLAVSALVVVVALLLAVMSYLVARSVLRPLTILREGTEIIGSGNLNHKVGNHARDEIGDLGRAFDTMTSRLKSVTASREELRREIEARERAEAGETRLGRILNSSSNEIYVFDALTLNFIDVNLGARNNLGYTMNELMRLSPLDLMPAFTYDSFEALAPPLRQGEQETLLFETYHRRKDGSTYPVEVRLQLMQQELQPVFVAVIQDITERISTQEELLVLTGKLTASNKDLQDFAYVVSHDLQEPLRMVSSYLQLLKRRYGDKLGEDADEFIGFAVDGSQRMSAMIDGLLQYSRVETQGSPFEAIDMESLMDDVLANLSLQIQDSRATVKHEPLPRVQADPDQLGRVLQNLIGNALKFRADEPPLIRIAAQREQDEWIISVADNGIGIDPKDNERIFIMFQRLHGRGEYPGSGIGLAVCKRIIERHGGRIWVQSATAEGEGAIFRFSLPAIKELNHGNAN